MTRWSHFDEWDPETDPALRRMADALALNAASPPETAQDGPERPAQLPAAATVEPAVAAPSRRERISSLVARIRAGDLSAVDALRRLIE